ncbi:predicted protein [Plenodomus lingam JN3]|uniref:Predicted protein n=1 Tax=Leptosphaeria maculans (strain JN3 / isolate v23.1.3 / race Av1-4-5-6-7-8) TaxID=985895 RepID=E4ZHP0_LEPMJ|nr:predicted protein [Plenodomus lingam JN3]CBX90873.1 predicted protein [Plenodomus lingam JN3]
MAHSIGLDPQWIRRFKIVQWGPNQWVEKVQNVFHHFLDSHQVSQSIQNSASLLITIILKLSLSLLTATLGLVSAAAVAQDVASVAAERCQDDCAAQAPDGIGTVVAYCRWQMGIRPWDRPKCNS